MPYNFSQINLDFCSNCSFSCFRSFDLHPYHTNIKVASLRKLVRHSGVHVCIATTEKSKKNVSFYVFCRKVCSCHLHAG